MTEDQNRELSDAALALIAERFKVLAEPMRLRILHTLGGGELGVSEIIAAVGGLQANISKQLGVLLQAGLVRRRKQGLRVFYRVADATFFELCQLVCSSLHERLAAQVEEIESAVALRKGA